MLKITNTLTGSKQVFKPLSGPDVKMYVCGVTPYDHSHLGHGRCYVAFDLLFRTLRLLNYRVTYCRNFTDIDDKLLNKAEQQFGDRHRYNELADLYIEKFHKDMTALNCLSPDLEPRVTENMSIIIEFIQKLIDAGYAYAVAGDVYFHIRSFAAYGSLSKHKLEDLRAGSRVDIEQNKKDPLDFALWKNEQQGEFWSSPWGYGRPGWHIECSALALRYLGEQIDIHGGGMDLIFPHHENEIAQSEALHQMPFSQFWIHNGLITLNKEKMSKSLGNYFIMQEVFKEFDPMVIRFYFLNHHYRAPLDFSFDDVRSLEKSYSRLVRVFESYDTSCDLEKIKENPLIGRMIEFISDDLNTVGMFGVVFENLSEIVKNSATACAVKCFLQHVLGLRLEPIAQIQVAITPEVQKLIDERELARTQKDWARADTIRDQLKQMGVDVQDKKI